MATNQSQQSRTSVGGVVGDAVEQVRTPLLAAVGAGDLASQAVIDVVNKARSTVRQTTGEPSTAVDLDELRSRLDSSELRKLVDPDELRKLVDTEELRKLVDSYTKAAADLYRYLAEHGEGAWDKARSQPQVKQALDQLEDAVTTAQERVEGATGGARGFAEDVLSRVSRTTRSAGEKTARSTQQATAKAADSAAETVSEAGEKLASETRSATKKAANKADAAGGGARKSTNSTKSTKSTGSTQSVKPEPRNTGTTRKANGSTRDEK